ncbi:hypothetical protein NCCP2716_24870 [Sporosarcina sp. NCCP-2716]|uniref:DUF2225 domain-containing protein n=1 Tax=Sporosarcina sp. NCCP-2716 TaxID=2943679 RepID=UPI00203D04DA|nr:DUF2225 domain-containing protein [Sporosarcina sp. NCCP-2716]GKV69989.1 hypothetical protein NCCP2716_24870 [Sporosarcina sp. NCCP-2716]
MEVTPLYDKKMTCLNCSEHFTTTKVRSRFARVASTDTDFKPNYKDPAVNPLYYNIAVCPACGFSFTDDFAPYFAPGTKEQIASVISSGWQPRSLGGERSFVEAIEAYKLGYLSAMMKKEKALTTAGIAVRTAWLYRVAGSREEEQRFLMLARNLYEEAYSNDDHTGTQMSEARVLYMVAELSYRIGDREKAIQYFSRIIESQRTSTEPQLIEMTKERWQEIREQT